VVLEREPYSLFIFCSEGVAVVYVIDDEGEGRGMLEHFCHWRAT